MVLYAGANVAWLYLAGQVRGRYGAFAVPALLIVVAGLISLAVAEYPRLALRELRTVVLGPAVFYVLTRAVLRGSERDDRGGDALHLAGAFLMGAAGATLLALGQVAPGRGPGRRRGCDPRRRLLYRSPNNLAPAPRPGPPLAFALALYRRAGTPPLAVCRRCAPLCLGPVLHLFPGEPGWPAGVSLAVVAIPYVGHAAPGARRLLLWGTVGAVPPAARHRPGPARRAPPLPAGARRHRVLRLRLWQAALEMVRDHPLRGIGLDQFLYLYPRYMHPVGWRRPNLSHPLTIWCSTSGSGSVY